MNLIFIALSLTTSLFTSLAVADSRVALPLPPVSSLPEVPLPSSDFVYTGVGPEVPNPILPIVGDFSAACYPGANTPVLAISRVGEYVHIRGESRVKQNLEFLVRTLHDAGKLIDLGDEVADGTFKFEFTAPLSGGFIRSTTITSSLSAGPYERKQILREISFETGGYHSAPLIPITIEVKGLRFQTQLRFQQLEMKDPSTNSLDEQVSFDFRNNFFETYPLTPVECYQENLALRK